MTKTCAARRCSGLVSPKAGSGGPEKLYCSDACARAESKARRRDRSPPRPAAGVCARVGCGKPCAQPGRRGPVTAFCSRKCSAVNFTSGAPRRVKAAGFGAAIDEFSPVEILDRDGWKCGLCGQDTPKDLRGTRRQNAPEVDHKIPVSRGGAHTRENCWCLCRKCNRRKSNHTLEELDALDMRPRFG